MLNQCRSDEFIVNLQDPSSMKWVSMRAISDPIAEAGGGWGSLVRAQEVNRGNDMGTHQM